MTVLQHRSARIALFGLLIGTCLAVSPRGGVAEQASQPAFPPAAQLDTGVNHSCAILAGGSVRCWGYGPNGQIGYPNTAAIGDDESPGSLGPVDLGAGHTAVAISAGGFHTCAILDDASVRCWGFGADGRLGYGSTSDVGDNETPGSAGAVDLGEGRTAKAISAGYGHTCAILDDSTLRCWGYGDHGALGYGNFDAIGDTESPGVAGPVKLGEGRTAKAVSAGRDFTCALLDDNSVRCWGAVLNGRLGLPGSVNNFGDDETPDSVGPVALGTGRTAKAISAGELHACALLDDNSVRCWGEGSEGALGYGNTDTIGDNEAPASAGPVNLGAGRTATAISAGRHTCARLDDGSVRCWGRNREGQLGYANNIWIGDDEAPGSVAPVNLGAGRTGMAISVSERHTCARLDDGNVRCWGIGGNGRLGYCGELTVGDNETPAVAGPVNLEGASCPPAGFGPTPAAADGGSDDAGGPAVPAVDPDPNGLEAQAARRRGLDGCLAVVGVHARRETRSARLLSGSRRARAIRHLRRHRSQSRRRCLSRWGRTPGRVTGLRARALSNRTVVLSFTAPGSDGSRPPAADTYLVKQSPRPIRDARAFRRAQTLCSGSCRFPTATGVGAAITLSVAGLSTRTTYYYAVAARDNVSRRLGPRTRAVKVRTRHWCYRHACKYGSRAPQP